MYYIPVGDHESDIRAIYGINHAEDFLNMAKNFDGIEGMPRHLLPIGHNAGGHPYVLVLEGPLRGQVRHLATDELYELGDEVPLHFVAKDMREFAQLLQGEPVDIRYY